jgi:energy-coupling factor transporter ATP-binding protein EcfA2
MAAVIIYGPQGCGKTRHADALARLYEKTEVVECDDLPMDFWTAGEFGEHSLVLTNNRMLADYHRDTYGATIVEISKALEMLARWRG